MIKTYDNDAIKDCKQPFAIKYGSTWYAFPNAVTEATISDYKYWANDSGRSMTGSMKGTLIGIFPKLQVTIGKQSAAERAVLTKCLNQTSATVRAYSVERQRFEQASFYFGDVANKIKHWDKYGTLGTMLSSGNQSYTCKSTFDSIQLSVIANDRRSTK
jgi:hypothetical protein